MSIHLHSLSQSPGMRHLFIHVIRLFEIILIHTVQTVQRHTEQHWTDKTVYIVTTVQYLFLFSLECCSCFSKPGIYLQFYKEWTSVCICNSLHCEYFLECRTKNTTVSKKQDRRSYIYIQGDIASQVCVAYCLEDVHNMCAKVSAMMSLRKRKRQVSLSVHVWFVPSGLL